jgi:hypothetical protein
MPLRPGGSPQARRVRGVHAAAADLDAFHAKRLKCSSSKGPGQASHALSLLVPLTRRSPNAPRSPALEQLMTVPLGLWI